MPTNPDSLLSLGRSVIRVEAAAIAQLESRIDQNFVRACELLIACKGRIVVCGIGKSGHIGAKLAATLASTGSPAFFVHAAEASHGDLGMFRSDDVVIAISYSGGSSELLILTPGIRRMGIPLISLCGEPDSPLAQASDIVLNTHVEREACPLGLTPTASTTASLAFGDALAIALLGARGFTEEDFARSHPGGRLGRRLLIQVADVMTQGAACPRSLDTASLRDAVAEITSKGLGMVALTNDNDELTGVFTDGDLRRTFDRDVDIRNLTVSSIMTHNPATITREEMAFNAVTRMQELRITSLPVVTDNKLEGVVTMHALLAAGVV
ncbi:KpsF/GutQ family sugar-phosphate isomerase [Granulosicoccus antarcticus]|uniref:Arabinose 5-phosphate isomerase n=1 Tax=Granulosicoccus antarcticus IMCC3135 TaxID=1192854 RepID=A0A2Z2NX43_9GAMM|nr:KpsF/GutQ family sugar-phosphate isomerase [Granulosicoccus antarcticus]ASJ75919.1 Arabinose 5-phosphate isomerase KdsD [Granulosicoccus antarcticus IMCC3135]